MSVKSSKHGFLPFTPRALRLAVRGGQILIPSLLVVPSLLIFVYLLFETTKLSREKIRQQFAVDSAAFIQMGDYTNLLNRTAYVDGAFPYRIFKEAYDCPPEKKLQAARDGDPEVCPYQMLYDAGAIPKYTGDTEGSPPTPLDDKAKWTIQFSDARPDYAGNPSSKIPTPLFDLITKKQAIELYIGFKGEATGIYKFYAQVYSLLGSVEASQWTVFDRLTKTFNFYRKSYTLNTNSQECVTGACEGLSAGFIGSRLEKDHNFFMHYISSIEFYAKVYTGATLPPYYIGRTNPPMDMTVITPDGLFQLATVTDGILDKLGGGLDVYQGWTPPKNFFNVNFGGGCSMGRPCVHTLIATQCPQLGSGNNCVWPSPTPKYQTRQYP